MELQCFLPRSVSFKAQVIGVNDKSPAMKPMTKEKGTNQFLPRTAAENNENARNNVRLRISTGAGMHCDMSASNSKPPCPYWRSLEQRATPP